MPSSSDGATTAASSRRAPVRPPVPCCAGQTRGRPQKTERPHPRRRGHPIHHHVTGPASRSARQGKAGSPSPPRTAPPREPPEPELAGNPLKAPGGSQTFFQACRHPPSSPRPRSLIIGWPGQPRPGRPLTGRRSRERSAPLDPSTRPTGTGSCRRQGRKVKHAHTLIKEATDSPKQPRCVG